MDRDLRAAIGGAKYFRRRNLSLEAWKAARAGYSRRQAHARAQLGLKVCVLLHDLIPLMTPQYTEDEICHRFHD